MEVTEPPDDEVLDVVDWAGTVIGQARRSAVHRDGLWHRVFHCLIVRRGEPPTVVLQRRPRHAKSFAGLLDLSTTGHLTTGESPRDGVREMREEIGLDVDPDDLVAVGRRFIAVTDGEGDNREIAYAFLLADDRPLEAYALDGCDVAGLVEISTTDLLTIVADPAATATVTECDLTGVLRPGTVRGADLVPDVDGYWTVLTVMAERFARGQHPISV